MNSIKESSLAVGATSAVGEESGVSVLDTEVDIELLTASVSPTALSAVGVILPTENCPHAIATSKLTAKGSVQRY